MFEFKCTVRMKLNVRGWKNFQYVCIKIQSDFCNSVSIHIRIFNLKKLYNFITFFHIYNNGKNGFAFFCMTYHQQYMKIRFDFVISISKAALFTIHSMVKITYFAECGNLVTFVRKAIYILLYIPSKIA